MPRHQVFDLHVALLGEPFVDVGLGLGERLTA